MVADRIVAGKYRLLHQIGIGAMGSVYLARHEELGREIALKLMLPELADSQTAVARFKREARAASRVEDPRIVTLFDFGQAEDGQLYIAMELLRGQNLEERLDRGPLDPGDALKVALEVTSALESAHAAAVVHRDLKPANIMLTEGGGIKVLDFGIARIHQPEARPQVDGVDDVKLTRDGTVMGTPMYMAPEAVAGHDAGPPADIYALGVILFEMLTGVPPFDDPEPIIVMGMHLRDDPPRLADLAPGKELPEELEALVSDMLCKKPEVRPDAPSLVRRLTELSKALPSLATRRRTQLRRKRIMMVLGALAIVAIVGPLSIWGAMRFAARSPQQAENPTASARSAEGTPRAAAPPEVEAELATLRLTSSVPCRAEIDGEPAGLTPVEPRELALGEHRLRCVRESDGSAIEARVEASSGSEIVHHFAFADATEESEGGAAGARRSNGGRNGRPGGTTTTGGRRNNTQSGGRTGGLPGLAGTW